MKPIHVIVLLLLLSPLTTLAHLQEPEQTDDRDFAITKLTDNISVLIGINGFTGGNIAILSGDDGVIMIDDSMPPLGEKLKASIAKVTDKPVDFIINTHVHGDHMANNEFFAKDGTWIVGHENIRAQLKKKGMPTPRGPEKPSDKMLPVITFNDEMTFHLNGQEAKIIHPSASHTDGDAFIHYTDANIIHTGDLMFNYLFPYIDLDSGGDVDGYIAAQKAMYALADDETQIIPGHGPMATKADLKASIDMLEDSKAIISKHIADGLTADQVIAANPLQKYHDKWNWGFITTERMTRQLYRGLK